ncbi:MAG: bifunctional precorrin-2 dehydrogenase/sirohydrochlorin ferrochelatase [Acidobacteria bacterium]|nr:bifunctional precorrin-2 dehydrogenase/sirohydrochlorin ferrochelatase [Acidobacteriota bacterium]
MFYPVFLDLRGKPVLVVGAGPVALRKVKGLLECGAVVTVVSPEVAEGFAGLTFALRRRRFRASDIADQVLVFAATNDRATNHRVAILATQHGVAVNVADAPEECSFLVPARVRRGDLQVAISTSGRSPRVAKALRERMEALLDEQLDQGLSR